MTRSSGILLAALALAGCHKKPAAAPPAPVPAVDAALAKAAPPQPRAAQPTRHQLSKQQRAAFRKALDEGRRHQQAGELVAARQAFQAALRIQPHDAQALVELGWNAFNAGDLTAAETATRRGAVLAATANLKAAALYNLGRIEEEREHKELAVAAYAQSLELRRNQTVHDRLAGLDPAVAAGFDDPLEPRAMEGPYASLEAYCQHFLAANTDPVAEAFCNVEATHDPAGPVELAAPAGPWQAAKIIAAGDSDGADCNLLVQAPGGWYALTLTQCENRGSEQVDVTVDELALADVIPGDPLELRVRVVAGEHHSGYGANDEREIEWDDTHWFVVCGIGPSGHPSCTPQMPTLMESGLDHPDREGDGGTPDQHTTIAIDARFHPDGQLELTADPGKLDPEQRELLGVHKLRFR